MPLPSSSESGKIIDIVKVLPGGRVTIPKDIRQVFNIDPGARLVVYIDEKNRTITYRLLADSLLKKVI